MQYYMITTRCNMSCAHCVYGCGKEGEDMPFEIFKMALDKWSPWLNATRQMINLGGGEPTVHPQFWRFLSYAMEKGRVWLATNGKKTTDFMILTKLAKENRISLTLSQDQYHDPIDPKALEYFKEGLVKQKHRPGWETPKGKPKNREIRTVVELRVGGRCRDGVRRCPCPRIHVRPNGDFYGCGCEDAPKIGSAQNGLIEKYRLMMPHFDKKDPKLRLCSKRWIKNG